MTTPDIDKLIAELRRALAAADLGNPRSYESEYHLARNARNALPAILAHIENLKRLLEQEQCEHLATRERLVVAELTVAANKSTRP